ncbi:hypothetical protein ILUMI_19948 [Ignelater luminosus]|uniref:Uncharacterized protein n=1 Tax=Ignelater luminosus TaxID=2038154 RepID=A0A8K0CLX5_IGNLU|nr:hypothetical protein ILUMI_19948 [Ignelater luminosus]
MSQIVIPDNQKDLTNKLMYEDELSENYEVWFKYIKMAEYKLEGDIPYIEKLSSTLHQSQICSEIHVPMIAFCLIEQIYGARHRGSSQYTYKIVQKLATFFPVNSRKFRWFLARFEIRMGNLEKAKDIVNLVLPRIPTKQLFGNMENAQAILQTFASLCKHQLRKPRALSAVRALSSAIPQQVRRLHAPEFSRRYVSVDLLIDQDGQQEHQHVIPPVDHRENRTAIMPNGDFICKIHPQEENPGPRKRKKRNKRQRARQAASQEVIPETATEDTADSPSPVPPQLARMESRPTSAASSRSYAEHGSRAHRRRRLRESQPPLPEEPSSTVRGSTATGPYG